MGDVLTQSQIDALLSSVQESGNFNNAEAEKTESAQKYRKYNFHTPKKFTKDRLKLLRSVYENYARLISSHLTSLLRLSCEVELFEIEEQRYYEFNNALADDSLLAFVNVWVDEAQEEEEEPVLIVMSDGTMYAMLDRLLGGSGDSSSDSSEEDSSSGHTDIEIALYETILNHLAPIMNDVWQNYLSIRFAHRKIESNPNLIQVMPIDEIVVIITFNITVSGTAGQISICLPGGILEAVFKHFERTTFMGSRKKDSQTSKEKDNIIQGIENSILEIKAEFNPSTILFEELYTLNVGDYLNLNSSKDSEINVNIGGKPWFRGRLGVYKDNVAVKLTGMHNEERIKNPGGKENE